MPIKQYFISPDTEAVEVEFVNAMVEEIAPRYGLEPALVKAIIKQESNNEIFARRYDKKPLSGQKWFNDAMATNRFDVKDKKWYYSCGLMQPLLIVARLEHGFMGSLYDLFDPKANIEIGCKILCKQLTRYNGDVKKAISAYNYGSYSMNNDKDYTQPVYKYYKDFGGTK